MGDIMERFWKRYLNADPLRRMKIIENMVKKRGFDELIKIDDKMKMHTFATVLNGYFEDIAYMAGHLVAVEKDKEIKELELQIKKTNMLFKKLEGVVKGEL